MLLHIHVITPDVLSESETSFSASWVRQGDGASALLFIVYFAKNPKNAIIKGG